MYRAWRGSEERRLGSDDKGEFDTGRDEAGVAMTEVGMCGLAERDLRSALLFNFIPFFIFSVLLLRLLSLCVDALPVL